MLERVMDAATKAIDSAILWQLGSLGVPEPDVIEFPPVDPEGYWGAARLHPDPDIHVTTELCMGPVHRFDLEAPSRGPGSHPGSLKLIARAHMLEGEAEAPFVLMLHGFAVPVAWYEEAQCRVLNRLGASAVRMDNPWHLRRRARGYRSGEGFMTADPRRLVASVRQAVEDAARLVAWGRARSRHVAVLGVSLGGLIACLLAAHVELDSMVAVAPFCDPSHTLINNLPWNLRRRLGLTPTSFGPWGPDRETAERALRGALAPVIVSNFPEPATPPERIVLVCPSNDSVVGPGPIMELAHRWGATMWDERHSHISVMNDRGLTERINSWLLASHEAPAIAVAR